MQRTIIRKRIISTTLFDLTLVNSSCLPLHLLLPSQFQIQNSIRNQYTIQTLQIIYLYILQIQFIQNQFIIIQFKNLQIIIIPNLQIQLIQFPQIPLIQSQVIKIIHIIPKQKIQLIPRDKLTLPLATDLTTILLNNKYQNERGPSTNPKAKGQPINVVQKQLQHKLKTAQTKAGVDRLLDQIHLTPYSP